MRMLFVCLSVRAFLTATILERANAGAPKKIISSDIAVSTVAVENGENKAKDMTPRTRPAPHKPATIKLARIANLADSTAEEITAPFFSVVLLSTASLPTNSSTDVSGGLRGFQSLGTGRPAPMVAPKSR